MITWEQNHSLVHFGILGQKWGVRRFQNEDGTLTEEGRKRYLKGYEDAERKADEDIKRAEGQIADIQKNGWGAKSAFENSLVKQMRDEGVIDDPELSKYYLKTFENAFKQDIKDAKLSKKVAQEARNFIESTSNVTYDDIVMTSRQIDTKNKTTSLSEQAKKIGDELGLERKMYGIKIPDYTKETAKRLKANYNEKEMRDFVNSVLADLKKETGTDLNSKSINIGKGDKKFSDLTVDQQFYVVYSMLSGNNEVI